MRTIQLTLIAVVACLSLIVERMSIEAIILALLFVALVMWESPIKKPKI